MWASLIEQKHCSQLYTGQYLVSQAAHIINITLNHALHINNILYTGPHWNQQLPFRVQEIVHFLIVDFHVGDLHFKVGVLAAELGDSVKHQITQPGYDPLPSTRHAPHHCVWLPWPYMYITFQSNWHIMHRRGAIQLGQIHFLITVSFLQKLHIFQGKASWHQIWFVEVFRP